MKTHCQRGHEYTEANTYYTINKRGYIGRICKECRRLNTIKYRNKNRNACRKQCKKYYNKNKLSIRNRSKIHSANRISNGLCISCKNGVAINGTQSCAECLQNRAKYKLSIKKKFFNIYGTKCVKCGIDELHLLTIQHKNNDGKFDKDGGVDLYRKILKLNEKRSDIETMCFGCNIEAFILNFDKTSRRSQYRIEIKKRVMDIYSGSCNCCKESNIHKLSIDHLDPDQKKLDKDRFNGSSEFYYYLSKLPERRSDLQVLCINCNESKRYNNGICYHKGVPCQV